MIMTDPIADMLTRVRNALQARHETSGNSCKQRKKLKSLRF